MWTVLCSSTHACTTTPRAACSVLRVVVRALLPYYCTPLYKNKVLLYMNNMSTRNPNPCPRTTRAFSFKNIKEPPYSVHAARAGARGAARCFDCEVNERTTSGNIAHGSDMRVQLHTHTRIVRGGGARVMPAFSVAVCGRLHASVRERLRQHEEGGGDEARGAGSEGEADGPQAD